MTRMSTEVVICRQAADGNACVQDLRKTSIHHRCHRLHHLLRPSIKVRFYYIHSMSPPLGLGILWRTGKACPLGRGSQQ